MIMNKSNYYISIVLIASLLYLSLGYLFQYLNFIRFRFSIFGMCLFVLGVAFLSIFGKENRPVFLIYSVLLLLASFYVPF